MYMNYRLGMLPTGLGMCGSLASFAFGDNPLGSVPKEVVGAGAATLIDYLARFFRAGPPPGCEKLPGAWEGKSKALDLEGFHLQEVR